MNCTGWRIHRKDCGPWWKSVNRIGRIVRQQFKSKLKKIEERWFADALTHWQARHTLDFQFAGMGSGEGRENRPRARHCNRLKSRKPGYPPMPQRLRRSSPEG